MIDLLTLDCGCQLDNGSWDLCLFHRYKDGAMDKDGPIPLSNLDGEDTCSVTENRSTVSQKGLGRVTDQARLAIPITSAKSLSLEPYEASTRQARAEREAVKTNSRLQHKRRPPWHCPTCTCYSEK